MFALDAIEITVENTGVAIKTEEDEGVGERFEEIGYWRFEGLIRLGVMVHD